MHKGERFPEFKEDSAMIDVEAEPDYKRITARDLRAALRKNDDYTQAQEKELTVFPDTGDKAHQQVFAFWGKRVPTDIRLHRIAFSAEAQAHFQQLLNPEEDRWDSDLKTPTGLPMRRSDPPSYQGPFKS
jgi:hypothetical protein